MTHPELTDEQNAKLDAAKDFISDLIIETVLVDGKDVVRVMKYVYDGGDRPIGNAYILEELASLNDA